MLNVHKRIALGCLMVLVLSAAGKATVLAQEAPHATPVDPGVAERKARGQAAAKAFMLGHYQEALDTYLDLFVQSNGRPEYLRNIGRCQQKLNQYDLAISSLKDYLLRSKSVTGDERSEVQGFIAEIQAAKAAATDANKAAPSAAVVQPAPASPVVDVAAQPPPVSLMPSPGPAPSTEPSTLSARSSTPTPAQPAAMSGLKVGGIVAAIGAAVLAAGGTAMLISANSTYDDAKMAGCPGSATVDCGSKASAVSSSNTLSKVFYVGAAVAAVAGGTMLYLAPTSTGGTQVGFTTRMVF